MKHCTGTEYLESQILDLMPYPPGPMRDAARVEIHKHLQQWAEADETAVLGDHNMIPSLEVEISQLKEKVAELTKLLDTPMESDPSFGPVPVEIVSAARKVRTYFILQNIAYWSFQGICDGGFIKKYQDANSSVTNLGKELYALRNGDWLREVGKKMEDHLREVLPRGSIVPLATKLLSFVNNGLYNHDKRP